MWISRKEWEEKCDSNRELLKDKAEKIDLIEKLNMELIDIENALNMAKEDVKYKENMNNVLKERLDAFDKDNSILMDANQKLIDWVNKMINEVGVYEVKDKHSITIPVYKNPVKTYSGKMENLKEQLPDFMNQEEIIIPEIRFVRMK